MTKIRIEATEMQMVQIMAGISTIGPKELIQLSTTITNLHCTCAEKLHCAVTITYNDGAHDEGTYPSTSSPACSR